jgi:hypothetical protein
MLPRTVEWFPRKAFPPAAKAALGWGAEYWDSDPIHYEDWEAVCDRLVAVSRERNRKLPTKADLAELSDHLLDDVLVELMPRQVIEHMFVDLSARGATPSTGIDPPIGA